MIANSLPAGQLPSGNIQMQVVGQPAQLPASALAQVPVKEEHYMTIWEALRESSEKNLRKAVGKDDEVLAFADEGNNSKLRLVDVVSKGVERISNDKAKLESAYDSDKQSNAFSFSLGNLKIEKK